VMLAKDPAERWPVARVRDDLRRIARGEPSEAPAPHGRDESATAVMATQPVPPPAQEPDTTTRSTAAPAATGGRSLGWVAAVLALVLVAGIGTWLLWPRDEEPGDAGGSGAGDDPSASAEPSPSEDPTTESPSESPSESPESEEPTTEPPPSNAAGGTPAAMRSFVEDYFSRVTTDPEATFALLTPEFQAASGGFEGYSGFWGTIESATPSAIKADPRSLTTTYTIDFVTESGQTRTEQGQLQLEQQGDGFLIAGEG
jgi:hypothetical protein